MSSDLEKDKVKTWAEKSADSYIKECGGKAEAIDYMIDDANADCRTSLDNDELLAIIKNVLGFDSGVKKHV